jgi:serine phosphatase RsbU (regulator of sigma subunit)
MRILVGWNDAAEADLLGTYLQIGEGDARLCLTPEEALRIARGEGPWDAVLLSTSFPDDETGFTVFQQLREILPDAAFVGAVDNSDVYRIARFLTNGLRGYLIRDSAGDFMFLAQAVVEAAVQAVESERERFIAEKLREEIESVRRLQESIIPSRIICPDGYEVVARYESAQIRVIGGRPVTMAGGDYYDIFPLPDGRLAVIVGDASGHGMKACMSIMTMHTLIRLLRENRFDDAAAFVSQVNRNLCEQTIVSGEGGFITLIYGVLDPQAHSFTWTSAGHPVPMLHHLGSNEIAPIAGQEAPGLPLGIIPDAEYTVQHSEIPAGSRLLLYTDGLIEAFPVSDREHREFGEAGLKQAMRDAAASQLPETLQRLFDTSLEFTGGEGRHDDTSVVLLERA